ncbi:MAG: hypothetical protein OEZ06_25575 [Myxococcales bacterium]|nr:hypothetical protein [Myxococcales bacterium]
MPICDCGQVDTGARCGAPCSIGGCEPDQNCLTDGHCEAKACADGDDACPEGWVCDPDSVFSGPASPAPYVSGCRPAHCDEPGSEPCGPNRQCAASDSNAYCKLQECERCSDCECGTCRLRMFTDDGGQQVLRGLCEVRPGICVGP